MDTFEPTEPTELSTDVSISDLLSSENENQSADLESMQCMSYIPNIAIAAPTSAIVNEHRLAASGDFIVGKVTYGPKIKVIPLTYRNRCDWYDISKKENERSLVLNRRREDLSTVPEWVSMERDCPKELKYQEGPEILMYLPEYGVYCIFYTKNTLKEAGKDLWARGQGILCELESFWHTGKYQSWFKFRFKTTTDGVVQWPTNIKGVNKTISLDNKFAKVLSIFKDVRNISISTDEVIDR